MDRRDDLFRMHLFISLSVGISFKTCHIYTLVDHIISLLKDCHCVNHSFWLFVIDILVDRDAKGFDLFVPSSENYRTDRSAAKGVFDRIVGRLTD